MEETTTVRRTALAAARVYRAEPAAFPGLPLLVFFVFFFWLFRQDAT